MFRVKVIHKFRDMFTPSLVHTPGEILEIKEVDRLKRLMGDNPQGTKCVELLEAICPDSKKKKGPRIIFYQTYLYHIGGIETFLFNFVKHYKDRNVRVIIKQTELEPVIRLSQYCDVIIEQPGIIYETDVCVIDNYNGCSFLSKCKSKKNYLMVHVDLDAIKKLPQWSDLKINKLEKIDKIIAVSEAAHDGLKKAFNKDSEIIYNILEDDITKDDDTKFFITLSRATTEKGIGRIVQMAKRFKAAGKHFV